MSFFPTKNFDLSRCLKSTKPSMQVQVSIRGMEEFCKCCFIGHGGKKKKKK